MSYWQKIQNIASAAKELGTKSVRKLSAATGYSKSSIYRHQQAQKSRNRYPESQLWESAEGQQWLSRLVVASLLDLGIKRGVGAESLSSFFAHLRIDTHVGISPSALRRVQKQVERLIIEYGEEEQRQGIQTGGPQEIVGGVDETFMEQMILVMLDLPSGYLLMEEFSANRTTQTWCVRVEQVLEPFTGHVRYLVSDRAKPLISLALRHIGCRSIADLFHVSHEIAKGFSLPIQSRLTQAQKQLQQAQATVPETQTSLDDRPDALPSSLAQAVQHWQGVQTQYRNLLQQFNQTVHPFAVTDSAPQTAAVVAANLQATVAQLETLAQTNDLPKSHAKLKPVKNQIADLASLMDVWWDWVAHSLADQVSDFSHQHWLTHTLLPTVYWERQLANARTDPQRQCYLRALAQAQKHFQCHPHTHHFQTLALDHWYAWADTMVSRFQRTSSPVEGRNGYLSQINHASRGLPQQRLKTLTVLHNFELKRHDGSTAAQRFFGSSFPDLFEWLLPRMPELPRPRIRLTTTLSPPPSRCFLPVPP